MTYYNKEDILNNPIEKEKLGSTYNLDDIFNVDKTQWFNIQKVLLDNPWIRFMWCTGDNSIGKSYSAERLAMETIIKYINNDYQTSYLCGPVVWIRNLVQEAKSCKNAFSGWIRTYHMEDKLIANEFGVWKKEDYKKAKAGEVQDWNGILIAFVSIGSPDSTVPQNIQARLIIQDEFIPTNNTQRTFVLREAKKTFRKIFARTTRPIERGLTIPCIFISNPHTMDSDLLSDFEHEIDLVKTHAGLDQIEVNLDRGDVFWVFPKQFNIEDNAGSYDAWKGFEDSQPENYYFPDPGLRRILWHKPDDTVPVYNITATRKDYEFTVWLFDNNTKLYISKLEKRPENNNLKNWAIDSDCQNYHNIVIPSNKPELVVEKLGMIIKAFMNGDAVFYDSLWTETQVEPFRGTIDDMYTYCKQSKIL